MPYTIVQLNNNTVLIFVFYCVFRLVPMGQQILEHSQTKLPNSARRLEVLRNCIASIFDNKIADAKKTFPAVLSALKSRQARIALCHELALHKTGNQVIGMYIYCLFTLFKLL